MKLMKKIILPCVLFLCTVFALRLALKNDLKEYGDNQTVMKEDKEKIMYLTFDDGPSKNTQQILDILDEYQMKATFFITGESPEHYDWIKEEASRGHALAIHTFSHDYHHIYSSIEDYFSDMKLVSDLIFTQTGQESFLLRFPGGSSNTVSRKYSDGIMRNLADAVQARGYQYYDWNASCGDGDPNIDASSLAEQAKHEISGKESVMLLMHDGGGNQNTVEALPEILSYIKKEGYTVKVIDSTTPLFHHRIAN